MSDSVDGPLDHVLRSEPPWRTQGFRTECGKRAVDVASTISRDDFRAKVKKQGQQRAAMSTCMTCAHTAERWGTWDEDPVACLGRETYNRPWGDGKRDPFADELRAIAALIEARRDEHDGYISGLDDVGDLAARRAGKQYRNAVTRRR